MTWEDSGGQRHINSRIGLIAVPVDVVKGDFTFDVTLDPGAPGSGSTTVDICNPKFLPVMSLGVSATPNVTWFAHPNVPWVGVSPSNGSGSTTTQVSFNPNQLPAFGTYNVQIVWYGQVGGGATGSVATSGTVTIEPYP